MFFRNKPFYIKLFYVMFVILILFLFLFLILKTDLSLDTFYSLKDNWNKPYSKELYEKIQYTIGNIDLEKYNITEREYLPSEMFIYLPHMPDDFYDVLYDIRSNKIVDLCNITEEYYLQPEFFPSFNTSLSIIQNPPKDRWAPYGYGYYPGQTGVISSPGQCFSLCYFFTSGALVETWQPIKLKYNFPEKAQLKQNYKIDDIDVVQQNPDQIKQYFTITITPEQFLLPPNFPIYNKDSTIKIKVDVCLSDNIPNGVYAININKINADEEFINQEKKNIKGVIIEDMFSLANPHITIFVKVESIS